MTVNTERRKYARYAIANALTVHPEGVYQVIDISGGGFCFKCPPHTAIPETWTSDIINSILPIEEISARKIWISIHENGESRQPYLMFVGAEFDRLTKEMKLKLTELLENLASANKPPGH